MSVRRFAAAPALLDWMLDSYERQAVDEEGKAAILAHPDYAGMPSHDAVQVFEQALAVAERIGAVQLEYRSNPLERHEIARIRLINATPLYRHLGREPAVDIAARAAAGLADLVTGRPGPVAAIPGELVTGWARHDAPYGIEPGDSETASAFLRLLCGFLDGLHQDVDRRTFCRRATGDSKALERKGQAGRVVRVLASLYGLDPGDPASQLEALGIRKFPAPVCLRGPVAVMAEGIAVDLSPLRPYAALAPDQAAAVAPCSIPAYVLTVENFASFNRHVREIADDGVVLYTGGFPSRAVQTVIARLDHALPEDVPFLHWGDIDPWGLRIFRRIEEDLTRPLRPHLMDRATFERGLAAPAAADMRRLAESGSAVAALAALLASGAARHLEQEELDPMAPLHR